MKGTHLLRAALGVVLAGLIGACLAPDGGSMAAGSTIECARRDLLAALRVTDRRGSEGFREVEREQLAADLDYLTDVVDQASVRIASDNSPAGVELEVIVAQLNDPISRLTKAVRGVPGYVSDQIEAARQELRESADQLAAVEETGGECSLTPVPALVARGPATLAPQPQAGPIDPVAAPVDWLRLPPVGDLRYVGRASAEVAWIATDIDIRLTEDGGETWRLIGVEDMHSPVYTSFAFDGTRGWLVNLERDGDGLGAWRTEDGARTWTAMQFPFSEATMETMLPQVHLAGDTLIAQAQLESYVSRDGGDSWELLQLSEEAVALGEATRRDRLNGVEAARATGRDASGKTIVVELPEPPSFEGKERWQRTLGRKDLGDGTSLVAVAWMGAAPSQVAIYESTDSGQNWAIVGLVPVDAISATIFGSGSIVVFGTEGFNLATWTSNDRGRSWTNGLWIPTSLLAGSTNVGTWISPLDGWQFITIKCQHCVYGNEPGESEVVVATTNGGQDWRIVTPPQ